MSTHIRLTMKLFYATFQIYYFLLQVPDLYDQDLEISKLIFSHKYTIWYITSDKLWCHTMTHRQSYQVFGLKWWPRPSFECTETYIITKIYEKNMLSETNYDVIDSGIPYFRFEWWPETSFRSFESKIPKIINITKLHLNPK